MGNKIMGFTGFLFWNDMCVKKLLVLFLSFLTAWYPLAPYADEITDAGREAQDLSRELVDGYNSAQSQVDGNSLTIPTVQDGVFTNTGGQAFDMSELYPNEPGMYPSGQTPDISSLSGVSDDAQAMEQLSTNLQADYWTDANSNNPTVMGSAYQIMSEMANKPKPDLSNDPTFTTSRNIYSNIDEISANFGDCESTTLYQSITRTEHVPDNRTCMRVVDRTQMCDANHVLQLSADPISFSDEQVIRMGSPSIGFSWGTQVGNRKSFRINLSTGSERFKSYIRYRFYIEDPSIYSAFYVDGSISIDNAGSVWVRDAEGRNTVLRANAGMTWDENNLVYVPPSTGGVWGSYGANPSNILPLLKPGWNEIGASVYGSDGPNRITASFMVEVPANIEQDVWLPESCVSAAKGYYDGFASGSVTCTSTRDFDGSGCFFENNIRVCQDQLAVSPFTNVSPACEQVRVDVDYDFYQGTFCYTDANGNQICPSSGGSILDTCEPMEQSGQCSFVQQSCVVGAEAPDGTCYLLDEVWDCGVDVPINDTTTLSTYDCSGPVRCMGSDCLDPDKTESASFAETSALLNAVQMMSTDMNCASSDPSTCKVFGGTPYECKIAVGGVQDCCDVPTNVSPATYIQAILAMSKLDASLMALENGNLVKGAYQTLREPIANTVSTVTKPFTSYAENISSAVSEFVDPVQQVYDQIKEEITDAIRDTIQEMIGDTAADMGADAATSAGADAATDAMQDQAADSIMNNVAGAASTVMALYTAYVVAVMVIQILYECEQEEFELAAKKDVKSCNYVGSYCADEVLGQCIEKREAYCCFNSPLSRIINEQVAPQLTGGFGSPENPECGGLTVQQVSSIDWSQVDLGEWTGMLSQYGLLPDASISMESITGSGSALNRINGTRQSADVRAAERLDGLDIDELNREATNNTYTDTNGDL